ncbi:MAG: hypothetical protein RJA70_2647 [Pseudomonadota bacterium]|jgi:uncharacterized membrane protein YfcA
MDDLILIGLAGFFASFVDGALGMGFGATSSTLLLGAGLSPAAVSTTVNLAKVVTGVAAAVSHWRFRNIHPSLVIRLGLSGCAGALIGVGLLSVVSGAALKPLMAVLLTLVGLRILFRFSRRVAAKPESTNGAEDSPKLDKDGMPMFSQRGLTLIGVLGGVTNGLIGAWGPVVTPALLHRGVPPRYAIGTANTSEVAVAAASVVVLISSIGAGTFDVRVVAAMLGGGVLAAPVAAWVIRFVPARPMGIATAGLLLVTNTRELCTWSGLEGERVFFYAAAAALVGLAALAPRLFPTWTARPQVTR